MAVDVEARAVVADLKFVLGKGGGVLKRGGSGERGEREGGRRRGGS